MLPSDVIVEIRDENLERIGQLAPDEILTATFNPSMLDVGVWQVELPRTVLDERTNRQIRNPKADKLRRPGNGLVVTTPGGVFLSGKLTQSELKIDADSPGGRYVLSGVSDVERVLLGTTAYGAPTTYTLATQVGAVDARTDEAESLLYWYANRNAGPGAVVQRRDPFLTMATDLARGPILKKAPSKFQSMRELYLEIAREAFAADGTRLNVDVVQVGDGLEFRVLVAADRTKEIRLDFEHGLLSEVSFVESAPNVTESIAGDTVLRRKALASNPWGFRREKYVSNSSTDNAELDQAADAVLVEAQQDAMSFSAVASDESGREPGVHYNVGDMVTVVVPGFPGEPDPEIAVPVTGTLIRLDSSGVTAGMVLGSPTGNSWQDLISLKQQRLAARMNQVDRK